MRVGHIVQDQGQSVAQVVRQSGHGAGQPVERFGRCLGFGSGNLDHKARDAVATRPRPSLSKCDHGPLHAAELERVGQIVAHLIQVGCRQRARVGQDAGKEAGRRKQAVIVSAEDEDPLDPVDGYDRDGAFPGIERGRIDTRARNPVE